MTTHPTLAARLTIEDYLAAISVPVARHLNQNQWQYACPLHQESTPSFVVYRDTQRWRCYGACHDGGTLPYLITLKAGVPFWQAYQIAGIERTPLEGKEEGGAQHLVVKKTPYASREERAILTLAMQWWHQRLFEESQQAKEARFYLIQRGIAPSSLRSFPQIGFAPMDRDGSSSLAFRSFLARTSGLRNWEEIALWIGLLSQKNPRWMRYQGRVTFSCTFPRQGWQESWYIQGRTLSPENTCKYLGTAHIKKVPFTLPLAFVEYAATTVVESPIGPCVLASYGMPALATLGEGLDSALLDQFFSPFFLCQDHDEPKAILGKQGEIVGYRQPGEVQAESCLKVCQSLHLPAFRVQPLREWKGVDEWVNQVGSLSPLVQKMESVLQQAQVPLPNKWRERVY